MAEPANVPTTEPLVLRGLLARFGVAISEAEAAVHAGAPPREAILLLLADREIAARFDSAHGRPPTEDDIEELLDIYGVMAAKR